MTTPNFRRGAPQTAPVRDGSWLAKYDGECAYCGSALVAGESRVRWNEESTQVICGHHKP